MHLTNTRGPLAALASCLAFLAAAPAAGAAPQLDLEIAAPKGASAVLDELNVTAKCTEACTVGLEKLNVLRFNRAGEQQPGATEQELKGTKRLKAGQKGVFRVALGPSARAHIQGALQAKEAAVVQVVPTLAGAEWGYRSASIRTPAGPKLLLAQDQIVVPPKPKLRRAGTRYRVTIEGLQTTTWHYNRNTVMSDGCLSFSRGDGKQTIRFRSEKPAVARYSFLSNGDPVLLAPSGLMALHHLRFDIERDGKREAGVSGDNCGAGGGGHCPGCPGGGGPPPECTRKGSRKGFVAMLILTGKGSLVAHPGVINGALFDPSLSPNCAIEPFKKALGEVDLLDATHKFGDPTRGGGGGKVIVILRNKVTDPLDDGVGSTTTTVRWTVTFRRVG